MIVFGGTTEGKEIFYRLSEKGFSVTLSVATSIGEEALSSSKEDKKGRVLVGRKDLNELLELIKDYDICIDATHPFAVEITKNVSHACKKEGIPCLRLKREEEAGLLPKDYKTFPDMKAAAEHLLKKTEAGGNILLTTGSKDLGAFDGIPRERLFVRVLPVVGSLKACEEHKIPAKNVIAMWGPFSAGLNLSLIKEYDISFIVTKESGKEGGFPEKLEAATLAGIEAVIIERPKESGLTLEEIMLECERRVSESPL